MSATVEQDLRDQLAITTSVLHEIRRDRDDLAFRLRVVEHDLVHADREIRTLALQLAATWTAGVAA